MGLFDLEPMLWRQDPEKKGDFFTSFMRGYMGGKAAAKEESDASKKRALDEATRNLEARGGYNETTGVEEVIPEVVREAPLNEDGSASYQESAPMPGGNVPRGTMGGMAPRSVVVEPIPVTAANPQSRGWLERLARGYTGVAGGVGENWDAGLRAKGELDLNREQGQRAQQELEMRKRDEQRKIEDEMGRLKFQTAFQSSIKQQLAKRQADYARAAASGQQLPEFDPTPTQDEQINAWRVAMPSLGGKALNDAMAGEMGRALRDSIKDRELEARLTQEQEKSRSRESGAKTLADSRARIAEGRTIAQKLTAPERNYQAAKDIEADISQSKALEKEASTPEEAAAHKANTLALEKGLEEFKHAANLRGKNEVSVIELPNGLGFLLTKSDGSQSVIRGNNNAEKSAISVGLSKLRSNLSRMKDASEDERRVLKGENAKIERELSEFTTKPAASAPSKGDAMKATTTPQGSFSSEEAARKAGAKSGDVVTLIIDGVPRKAKLR